MEMNKLITVTVETVGQAYLEILRARGIKYFFGNSGADFTTGRARVSGRHPAWRVG